MKGVDESRAADNTGRNEIRVAHTRFPIGRNLYVRQSNLTRNGTNLCLRLLVF